MMPTTVLMTALYVLCALVSVGCAAALLSIYWNPSRRPARLVMWTGVCFTWFAASNTLMVADLVGTADRRLTVARAVTACVGASVLLFGLIWETH